MKQRIFAGVIGLFYYFCMTVPFVLFFTCSSLLRVDNIVYFTLLVFLVVVFIVYKKNMGKAHSSRFEGIFQIRYIDFFISLSLYSVALLPRLIYIKIIEGRVKQVSDFEMILLHAKNPVFTDNIRYYRNFAHKMIYPLILNAFGLIKQLDILYFQCAILAINSVLIYWICRRIGNRKVGILGGCFFAFWPSLVVYTSLVTEEHIGAILLLLIILVLIYMRDNIESICKKCGKGQIVGGLKVLVLKVLFPACTEGILLGCISVFKDWGGVVLLAVMLCLIYCVISSSQKAKSILFIACFAILLLSRITVQKGFQIIGKRQLGGLETNNGIVSMQMYETLDPDCSGGYDSQRCRDYFAILERHNYDYKKANFEAMGILRKRIMENPQKMPALLFRKGRAAYGDNSEMFAWSLAGVDVQYKYELARSLNLYVRFDKMIYYSMVLLMIFAAVFVYKFKGEMYFLLLLILGGGLANLLVESQSRYKYSIEPVWCIVASLSLMEVFEFIEKRSLLKLSVTEG